MHDLGRWVVTLSTLIGLGLALGLNPALYGATADMLARNTQVAARTAWMVGGLATGATILFVALQSFNPAHLVALAERDADALALSRTVDLIAGGVFLAAAAGVAVWRLRVPRRPDAARPARTHAHPGSYFWLGLSCSIVGFTTLPIMYTTGRLTAGVSDEILPRILAYAVFLLALIAPFVLLAGVWSRLPGAAGFVSRAYDRLIHLDLRWTYAIVLAVAGVVCLGFGLVAGR
ncbi:GAP family protein [Microbacterium invictum]|uniref:GAP family protein n=1 Tax=Microbacterium invictum TaxID=515415 RepID=A0ABZ0VG81_9MICO|nr:GAP family protein [Microbacterium invictum]WQB71656.1 GAP family protein [Microbacterium invictum]